MILKKSMIRTLKENKFQYAGVILLLLLAVTLYVSLSMAVTTLEERNARFTEDYKQETLHFVPSERIDASKLEEWEETFDITLETRSYYDADLDGSVLRVFSQTEEINRPYIAEGSNPEDDGEIAVSSVFAEKNDLHIGDTLEISGEPVEVTGFVYLPDYIYMLEQMTDLISDAEKFGIATASDRTMDQWADQSQIEITGWSRDGEVPEGFMEAVRTETTILQFVEAGDNPRIQFVDTEIEGAKSMNNTLPLFILALATAMVLLLMRRRIDMQRKEIGTLLALGFRRNELLRHYLGYAWVIGLSGTVLGLAAGAGLSVPLSDLYANYFNLPALSMFDFNPMVLVIAFILPLVLMLSVSAWGIHRALKVEPLTLLRPKEVTVGKKSWLERLPLLNRGTFIHRFRLRLLIRNKARSLYIFLGVMFSTVLLMFGFITFNSMDKLVETTYEDIMTYDYAVYYQSLNTENPEEGSDPFTRSEVKVKGNDTKLTGYGIETDTPYLNLLAEGEKLNPELEEGVVLSTPAAAVLDAAEGEDITLTNSLNDKEMTVQVAGVADVYIGSQIYLPREDFNEFLGYPNESYSAVWQTEKPERGESVYQIEDKQKVIDSFEATSGATRSAVIGMAVFAVVISVIVLTLLTHLIVEENSPSISLFKVMGYHNHEVSKLVLSVYTPVVILSYFISIPLAGLTLGQLMNSLVEQTGFILPTDVSWWMAGTGFIVIMLTYALSLALSKRKLKQVSLQEALKKQQD
ncbi:FtsX-like permease family protein [Halobacillus litoralis]|uniref:FtsX-like permease family protein n=1 Tax=Halobacillus litoralis TaxID=45668 RepID=A0A845DTK4_9BACI|nr:MULTISPECIES: ABC transporter permease [Halobacillus]MYL19692.1 FtsX-like permease family protein [Halobacillus litoralis]MYL28838.1 FtsX-like permease family protein [Halobacillus halophilus]MYL37089.1 FtsX-like permease family protein [Halobacillus litoralis]